MKIGDLVKFKLNCVPAGTWGHKLGYRVYLIDRISGGFVGLHNYYDAGLIAKANFILVSKANKNQ
jgi:hypothetical protein